MREEATFSDRPMTQGEWTDTIRRGVDSACFEEAWKEVGEAGIGSYKVARSVWRRLLRKSPYHTGLLNEHAEGIVKLASRHLQKVDGPSAEDILHFFDDTCKEINGVAVVYFIIGAMVGSFSALEALAAGGGPAKGDGDEPVD